MSNHNDHLANYEKFSARFSNLLDEARANGEAPPSAEVAINGMDLISQLYQRYPATEVSAKLCVQLAETLFFRYSEFGSGFVAVSAALDTQGDSTASEVAALLDRISLDATHSDAREVIEAEQIIH